MAAVSPERRERREWGGWVTPRIPRETRRHRWYLFPHSFAGELVEAVIGEWGLGAEDRVLDPFVGTGTTLLTGMEASVPTYGFDLSPLAVFASQTKTARYDRDLVLDGWRCLRRRLERVKGKRTGRKYAELVQRALPGGRLEAFDGIAAEIDGLGVQQRERDFFRLALLATVPAFSHAVGNGGWLRWTRKGRAAEGITDAFCARVRTMLSDLEDEGTVARGERGVSAVVMADARAMPCMAETYTAVITSPPYPNRHDYTRIFGIELLFAFQDPGSNRALRYQMFHSHPEARPERPGYSEYEPPERLAKSVKHVKDKRLLRMLEGYVLDMYLCLREIERVCRKNARAALVVGNAQYGGVPLEVDVLTAEVGEQAGLSCTEISTVRVRGNSAQQMGEFGRRDARESVVFFKKE